jgi:LPPG:FO 2-phospho-L-lactate transferase
MITVLSGGTGSLKLIRGLSRVAECPITIICNVGDNLWMHGLYVCPDIDTITYGLSGLLNEEKGWGIKGDTFNLLGQLAKYGSETWFRLGDKDFALHLLRTNLLQCGFSLSEITDMICEKLGIAIRVIPASDMHSETHIITEKGELHLQEFWVKRKGVDDVKNIKYHGARTAQPAPGVLNAILEAEMVIICPANPITSIGPILANSQIGGAIRKARRKVVAVSPVMGRKPVSGPAGKLMSSLGYAVSAIGIADFYSRFINVLVIDAKDIALTNEIKKIGVSVRTTKILMESFDDEVRLARFLMRLLVS